MPRLESLLAALMVLSGSTAFSQDRGPRTPRLQEFVTIHADVPYLKDDNPKHTLDLFIPKAPSTEKLPVIVFIHGGAWRSGSKARGGGRVAPFVMTGNYAGVSINYRLTGESIWPTQIHDCKAAIRWIKANAAKYGLDPDRIGVWGTSAGGHLVAMLGTSSGVPEMDGKLGVHSDVSTRVACVVDGFGPTNFLTMNQTAIKGARLDHDAPGSPESILVGGAIQKIPDRVAAANPITYVTADDAPFLIVHGTQDPLVAYNQSELLHAALKRAKVETTLVTIKGGGHGRGFGRDVARVISDFFAHHLRGEKKPWKDQTLPAAK